MTYTDENGMTAFVQQDALVHAGGIADDSYTVALCRVCHSDFDLFVNLNREQARTKFADWLTKTNMALWYKDESAF